MMARMLRRSGFTILEAPGGTEALEIREQHNGIQRLITDLTMPGLNGFDLAEQVAERWPELKILCVSGYRSGHAFRPQDSDRPWLEKQTMSCAGRCGSCQVAARQHPDPVT